MLSSAPNEAGPPDFPEDEAEAFDDQTQALLTTLGRFQRHVVAAQGGASNDTWAEACMEELIAALKIAMTQQWDAVQEVLTETGRVLRTYQDAGRAQMCVRFLAESYEVLCLMVGDLIVGSIRPGVVQKWRGLYDSVLKDVQASGLPLVGDAPSPGEPSQPQELFDEDTVDEAVEPQQDGEEAPPFTLPSLDEQPLVPVEDLPTLDDLPPLEGAVEAAAEDIEPSEEDERRHLVEEPNETVPADEGSEVMAEEDMAADEPQGDVEEAYEPVEDLAPLPSLGDESLMPPEVVDEENASQETASEADAREDGIAPFLDRLCEELTRVEHSEPSERTDAFVRLDDVLDSLEQAAVEDGRELAQELCAAMRAMCSDEALNEDSLDDKFLELAYGFCGTYAEAASDPPSEGKSGWLAECRAMLEARRSPLPPEPVVAPPPPEPSVVSADNDEDEAVEEVPVEAAAIPDIFKTAQEAFLRGDVADAKLLALRAAAGIAKAEADKAESSVKKAEKRLREGDASIEAARDEVRGAESGVSEAAAEVAQGEQRLREIRSRGQEIQGQLDEAEAELDALDERIRELQAQREAQAGLAAKVRDELSTTQAEESEADAALSGLVAEEEAARVRLEDARQSIKSLHFRRSEIESAMEKAREAYTRQCMTLKDIEQTLGHVGSGGATSPSDAELLF